MQRYTANGDGCSSTCQTEPGSHCCGNGVVDPGEECDDGNKNNGDGCSADCKNEAPKAVELLEDPKIGALTLVRNKDPASQREGFPEETYRTALTPAWTASSATSSSRRKR